MTWMLCIAPMDKKMSIIRGNKFTDSYTKRPNPQGVGKFLLSPSPCELKAINRGGGFCHERDLPDLKRAALAYAINIGAKSWTMFPFIGDAQRRMIVEFYNWPEIGIYNFDHPYSRNVKKFYWWFEAKLPAWWTDPERAVGVSKEGEAYDPRQ